MPTKPAAQRTYSHALALRADADAAFARGCELCVQADRLQRQAEALSRAGAAKRVEASQLGAQATRVGEVLDTQPVRAEGVRLRSEGMKLNGQAAEARRAGNQLKAKGKQLWDQANAVMAAALQKVADADD